MRILLNRGGLVIVLFVLTLFKALNGHAQTVGPTVPSSFTNTGPWNDFSAFHRNFTVISSITLKSVKIVPVNHWSLCSGATSSLTIDLYKDGVRIDDVTSTVNCGAVNTINLNFELLSGFYELRVRNVDNGQMALSNDASEKSITDVILINEHPDGYSGAFFDWIVEGKTGPVIPLPDTVRLCPGQTYDLNFGAYNGERWTSDEPFTTIDDANIRLEPTQSTVYYFEKPTLIPAGENIVINGDFEAGNTGFTTEYVYNPAVSDEGEYFIGNQGSHPMAGTSDHTLQNSSGMMYMGDGSSTIINPGPNQRGEYEWCQTLDAYPNTDYQIEFWARTATNSFQFAPFMYATVNGNNATAYLNVNSQWTASTGVWNSGSNTSMELCVRNAVSNDTRTGNNFLLDDISVMSSQPVLAYEAVDSVVVIVESSSVVDLGADENNCDLATTPITLDAGADWDSYTWSPNGETTQTISVSAPGTYSVSAMKAGGCSGSGDITFTATGCTACTPPNFSLLTTAGPICQGETKNFDVQLTSGTGPFTIYYSINGVAQTAMTGLSLGTHPITMSAQGVLSVDSVRDASCTNTTAQTSGVTAVNALPTVDLGSTQSVCSDGSTSLTLDAGNTGADYSWSPNGETSQTISVSSGATYSVDITDGNNCTGTGSVVITEISCTSSCGSNVDYNNWVQQGLSTAGNWTVAGDGLSVTQSENDQPTFYVKNEDVINVRFEGDIQVDTDFDNDWIGMVMGYQSPGLVGTYPYDVKTVVFAWKQSADNSLLEGFSLFEVDATITSDMDNRNVFQTLTGATTLATNYSVGSGWQDFTQHHLVVDYTANNITVYVDDNLIFDIDGTFEPGKVGFYGTSQPDVTYSNFTYEYLANIDVMDDSLCLGENLSASIDLTNTITYPVGTQFNWDFGDGNSSTGRDVTHTYASSGDYNVQLIVSDGGSCGDTAFYDVNIENCACTPPDFTLLTVASPICQGDTKNFDVQLTSGTGPFTIYYSVDGVAQTSMTGLSLGTHSIAMTAQGVLSVDSVQDVSCTNTTAQTSGVTAVNPLPTVDLGTTTTICDDGSTPLTLDAANAGADFSWTPNGETIQTITVNSAGIYGVSVTDGNNCSNTESIVITETPCSSCLSGDNDSDGICNDVDLDDDNDGILDTEECPGLVLGSGNNGLTVGTAFTSLLDASNITTAGVYFFNIGGTSFSTYVNSNGFIQIALDYGDGVGALPQVTSMNNVTRGILSPTVLSQFSNATEIRITESRGFLDVTTDNTTLINKLSNNVSLNSGKDDASFQNDWIGVGASTMTRSSGMGACYDGAFLTLHENIFWPCGDAWGMHWQPGKNYQRLEFSKGTNTGEMPDGESFTLWVKQSFSGCPDTDNDGIVNYLDLDSDNDGCFDALEGDGGILTSQLDANGMITGGIDANGVPTGSAGGQNDISSTDNLTLGTECIAACDDFDNDGICNDVDLDDDNDGILDTEECIDEAASWDFETPVVGTGNNNQGTTFQGWTLTGGGSSWINLINPPYGGNVPQTAAEGDQYVEVSGSGNFERVYTVTETGPLTVEIDFASWADGTESTQINIFEADGTTLVAQSPVVTTVPPTDWNNAWGNIASVTANVTPGDYVIKFQLGNYQAFDNVKISSVTVATCDTDNDGIINSFDLDSDNDGCPDALEGSASFTNADLSSSMLTGGVDANGIPTIATTSGQGLGTSQDNTIQSPACCDDFDNDGVCDVDDLDDDNDGILDELECNTGGTNDFQWSSPPNISGNTATGTINGITYTYTSTTPVQTTANIFSHSKFPASYNIPNTTSIKNTAANTNTLTFDSPVLNPVLIFSSIGNSGGLSVPIDFNSPIEVLWSTAVVQNSPTRITGTEGYAIVRMNGTFSSISFDYQTAENYANFMFGGDFVPSCGTCDIDNDALEACFDNDSDGDGCWDALEGDGGVLSSQVDANGMITGGVDANGIPLLIGASGQGLGSTLDATTQDLECTACTGADYVILTPDTSFCAGESGNIRIALTGAAPFNLYYTSSVDGAQSVLGINANEYSIPVSVAQTIQIDSVSNADCTDEEASTVIVTVNALPVVDLGGDVTICVGPALTLDAGNAGSTYLWNDNSTSQTLDVSTTGLYSVTVTDANSCTSQDEINVTADVLPSVNLGNDTLICDGNSVTLDAGPEASGSGSDVLWSTSAISQTITVSTTSTIGVRVSSSATCYDEDTIVVTVQQNPVVDLGSDNEICIGERYTLDAQNSGLDYSWNTSESTQTIEVTTQGNYSVTVTDALGCTGTDDFNLTVHVLPVIDVTLPADVCYDGGNVAIQVSPTGGTISGTGVLGGQFNPKDGNLVADQGSYVYYDYTDANNCSNRDSTLVTLRLEPTLSTNVTDTTICEGFQVVLSSSTDGNDSYRWVFDNDTIGYTNTVTADEGGEYTVIATDEYGCWSEEFVNLSIQLNPVVDLGDDITIKEGDSYVLSAGNTGLDYLWSTNEDSQEIVVSEEDLYDVIVTDDLGCVGTDEIFISVLMNLRIPNAFSPNGDGINDTWEIKYVEQHPLKSIKVFNRWGHIVYERFGGYLSWDGTYNGTSLPIGTYYYILALDNDEAQVFTGALTITK